MFDIRDLSEWYPLLPCDGSAVPVSLANILDIRITLELLPGATSDKMNYNDDAIVCRLKRIYQGSDEAWKADILVEGSCMPSVMQNKKIVIPVYEGRNTLPATMGNYVLLEQFAGIPDRAGGYVIHPDCLTIYQKAPYLDFFERSEISYTDSPGNDQASCKDRIVLDPIAVADGHNVTVELIGDTLTFTAADGVGLGVYTIPPYVPDPEAGDLSYSVIPGKGMRSINGYSDEVTIDTSRSIKLAATGDGDTVTLSISVEGGS